jgi:hypothetical protein
MIEDYEGRLNRAIKALTLRIHFMPEAAQAIALYRDMARELVRLEIERDELMDSKQWVAA